MKTLPQERRMARAEQPRGKNISRQIAFEYKLPRMRAPGICQYAADQSGGRSFRSCFVPILYHYYHPVFGMALASYRVYEPQQRQKEIRKIPPPGHWAGPRINRRFFHPEFPGNESLWPPLGG